MYKVNIDSLEVWANHGVADEEKILGQKFLISAELILNSTSVSHSDSVTSTVNYAEVCRVIKEVTTNEQFNLIETLAENIAERVLLEFYKIRSIKVKVSKPNAPIPMHFNNVSVEIERLWHTAYISLGSNIGNRTQYLNDAIKNIAQNPLCRVMAISEYINTEPVGNVPQDDYLNSCICIETLYSPHELLEMLHSIENNAGRKRVIKWGPRTLDLDIILFDDIIISDGTLTIPHVEMQNRLFVLEPLNEIAPYTIHPVYKCTVLELLTRLRKLSELKS